MYIVHMIPDTACEATVATAAPATPIGTTSIRSSIMLTIDEPTRNITGVILSPSDLSIPAVRL